MTINLWDIRNAVLDYFNSHVVASITVAPGKGQVQLNPGEQFDLKLTAKNSDGNTAQGVQINNVCYHVSVDDVNVAGLIVPQASVAVARENSSSNSAIVKPGTPENENVQQHLFLFRPAPNDRLIAGGTDSFTIHGLAGKFADGTNVQFHVHGDVDLPFLFPPDQESPNTKQPINIKPT
jgi:hypothetical protein